jgi:electron transport complex protein RnfD
MRDVIIALLPAAGCSVWFFGMRSVWLIAVCIAASVVTEAVCRLLMKRENSIGDLSAVLTGLLLALNLPPDLPLWMAVTGSVFAIAVAKQVFGGLGYNPFNPALAARAFMLVSFSEAMTRWSSSTWKAAAGVYAVTTATPLQYLKTFATDAWAKTPGADRMLDLSNISFLKTAFLGNVNGCLGEVCSVALLAGGAYLLLRRVITWHIPVSFIGTMAV